jgi:hypothetical protein
MQTKLLETISVYFKVLDQLLITYSALVKYFRKNVNTDLKKARHHLEGTGLIIQLVK